MLLQNLLEASEKALEDKFIYGACGSFAVALHDEIGGEFYAMFYKDEPYHIFIKKDSKNYDVKGKRNLPAMALSMVGSYDMENWKVEGPFTADKMPCKKPTPKNIELAKSFIASHKNRFKD